MARLFGAGRIYDAFSLGFRIPNLTRDLFAEGALSSAFVPMFTEYLATQSARRSRRASRISSATALILIVGRALRPGHPVQSALVGCSLRVAKPRPASSNSRSA